MSVVRLVSVSSQAKTEKKLAKNMLCYIYASYMQNIVNVI